MQFLAISRIRTEDFTDAEIAPHLENEAQAARRLYAEGSVRQIWYRGDQRGAVSLFEAENESEVLKHLNTLPLVQAGILELVNLIPLNPYRGFGPRD